MKRTHKSITIMILVAFFTTLTLATGCGGGGGGNYDSAYSPNPGSSTTPDPTGSPEPTQTPDPIPSQTPNPGATVTPTPTPSVSPEPSPTQTPEPTPTVSPSPSPTPTVTVNVTVVDEDSRQLLSGATVGFYQGGPLLNPPGEKTTGQNGTTQFVDELTPGVYTISSGLPGYYTASVSTTLSTGTNTIVIEMVKL